MQPPTTPDATDTGLGYAALGLLAFSCLILLFNVVGPAFSGVPLYCLNRGSNGVLGGLTVLAYGAQFLNVVLGVGSLILRLIRRRPAGRPSGAWGLLVGVVWVALVVSVPFLRSALVNVREPFSHHGPLCGGTPID